MLEDVLRMMRKMRLPAMADQLELLSKDPNFPNMSSEDALEQITNAEYSAEKNNTTQRRIKQAKLSEPSARLENIDYSPERKINHRLIDQLATNDYIVNHRNVVILGSTGCGKSYIGNCLGINACQAGYRVRFTRLSELMADFMTARIEGNLLKAYKIYRRYDLLIIDDFLLTETTSNEQKDLMELLEYRTRDKSTILCSQLSPEEWHDKLGGGYVADAILDRITNNSYTIVLEGDSQRKIRSNK
jgi:DNA replication protein DnaC